jgi:hypothetical protein
MIHLLNFLPYPVVIITMGFSVCVLIFYICKINRKEYPLSFCSLILICISSIVFLAVKTATELQIFINAQIQTTVAIVLMVLIISVFILLSIEAYKKGLKYNRLYKKVFWIYAIFLALLLLLFILMVIFIP